LVLDPNREPQPCVRLTSRDLCCALRQAATAP
jgi:hypothetical protein